MLKEARHEPVERIHFRCGFPGFNNIFLLLSSGVERINRPKVTVRISSMGMGGNAVVPLTIIVENTGNRPAKNIRLNVNQPDLISALAADSSDSLRKQVEACFSEQGLIPVIANGKQVSNSWRIDKRPIYLEHGPF